MLKSALFIATCLLISCLAHRDLPAADPAFISDKQLECHGEFQGHRFWMRLLPLDKQFGGRVLQLVYTQPTPETLGGTVLVDHPFILLDPRGAILAWNERQEGVSGIVLKDKTYSVTLGRFEGVKENAQLKQIDRKAPVNAPLWDTSVAPLILALCWKDGERSVSSLNFFQQEPPKPLKISWNTTTMTIGTDTWTIGADAQGRLKTLTKADKTLTLQIDGWKD